MVRQPKPRKMMKDGLEVEMYMAHALLPIHFDLPRHEIPLNTFVRTAEQIETIIASFNQKFFDGALEYEILVLPPEEGSFLAKLGLLVAGGAYILWNFIESDIGKGFIKGLTEHEPAYWSEDIGARIRAKTISLRSESATTLDAESERVLCREGAGLIVSMTKSFMLKDETELKSIGFTVSGFREGFAARNNFYKACNAMKDLRGIGFEEDHHFPIKRKDFVELQVSLPPLNEDDNEPWFVDIVDLKVTSPNWDKKDKPRCWKARDDNNRERLFTVEDEHFWSLVEAQKLNPHIIDTIKVQWAYHQVGKRLKNIKILKILEFNGSVLSDPLNDNALKEKLGNIQKPKKDHPDLFDF